MRLERGPHALVRLERRLRALVAVERGIRALVKQPRHGDEINVRLARDDGALIGIMMVVGFS